jgi:hypothetical protein
VSIALLPSHAHALRRSIEARGTRVITPDMPERALVVDVISLAQIVGQGWPREHATRFVSVALPALPSPLPELLRIGGVALAPFTSLGAVALEALAKLTSTPLISLSPAALESPEVTVSTLTHEDTHIDQGIHGGALHPVVYLARTDERVLACEAPAYACDLAFAFWCRGVDPKSYAAQLAEGLRAYGADEAMVGDARAILLSHAETLLAGLVPPVASLVRAVRVLTEAGVEGLPALP